jgi:hypothetical protein
MNSGSSNKLAIDEELRLESQGQRGNKEMWLALVGVVLITGVYGMVVLWYRAIPVASSFFGHMIGVIGFLLMLMTETLYSFRKRSRKARWGTMAAWLQFHIFTGIVGPFMVLLHTSWKFHGLAGATTLMTIIILLSGFTGRYIYTRIPRTIDGIDIMPFQGDAKADTLIRIRRIFAVWHTIHIPIGMALFAAAFIHIGAALYYATLLK